MNKRTSRGKYVFGFQTAEYPNSIALLRDDGSLIKQVVIEGRENTIEQLSDIAKGMLLKTGAEISNIKLVSVCIGPGSYTGIRGGLGFAKGICQYSDIPLVGVTVFEVMEYFGKKQSIIKAGESVVFTLDAKNERVFYSHDELDRVEVGNIYKVVQRFGENTKYAGSGSLVNRDIIESLLGKHAILADEKIHTIDAQGVAEFVIKTYNPKAYRYEQIYDLLPLYVLPPTITQAKKK